jgi:Flp pilus assembly protein TadB
MAIGTAVTGRHDMVVGLPPGSRSETARRNRKAWKHQCPGTTRAMNVLLIVLVLVVLLALGVLGAVLEGLLWLTAIAAIIFLIGAVFGYLRFKGSSST